MCTIRMFRFYFFQLTQTRSAATRNDQTRNFIFQLFRCRSIQHTYPSPWVQIMTVREEIDNSGRRSSAASEEKNHQPSSRFSQNAQAARESPIEKGNPHLRTVGEFVYQEEMQLLIGFQFRALAARVFLNSRIAILIGFRLVTSAGVRIMQECPIILAGTRFFIRNSKFWQF